MGVCGHWHPIRRPHEAVQRRLLPAVTADARSADDATALQGLVNLAINASGPGWYNTTFPPLDYVSNRFAKINGCHGKTRTSYRGGVPGNKTVCTTWLGCDGGGNVTS